VFLSVASHAFGWSAGSTFAVACALVALLGLLGPALFLQAEPEQPGVTTVFVRDIPKPGVAWVPETSAYLNPTYRLHPDPAGLALAYDIAGGLNYGGQRRTNKPAKSDLLLERTATQTPRRELTRKHFEVDLEQFGDMASQRETADLKIVGVLDRPYTSPS
jgi:hypothetical protein